MKNSPFYFLFVALALSFASEAFATGVFGTAISMGTEVFQNVRMIVYILGGIALLGFSVAAIFGKINWVWLASIALGLFIISIVDGIITWITDGQAGDVAKGLSGSAGSIYDPSGGGSGNLENVTD